MQHFVRFLLVLAVAALVAPATTQAHFKLVEPASWIVENNRGDPQKAGPCGGSNEDWGTPSGVVTELEGGSTMPLKITANDSLPFDEGWPAQHGATDQ